MDLVVPGPQDPGAIQTRNRSKLTMWSSLSWNYMPDSVHGSRLNLESFNIVNPVQSGTSIGRGGPEAGV